MSFVIHPESIKYYQHPTLGDQLYGDYIIFKFKFSFNDAKYQFVILIDPNNFKIDKIKIYKLNRELQKYEKIETEEYLSIINNEEFFNEYSKFVSYFMNDALYLQDINPSIIDQIIKHRKTFNALYTDENFEIFKNLLKLKETPYSNIIYPADYILKNNLEIKKNILQAFLIFIVKPINLKSDLFINPNNLEIDFDKYFKINFSTRQDQPITYQHILKSIKQQSKKPSILDPFVLEFENFHVFCYTINNNIPCFLTNFQLNILFCFKFNIQGDTITYDLNIYYDFFKYKFNYLFFFNLEIIIEKLTRHFEHIFINMVENFRHHYIFRSARQYCKHNSIYLGNEVLKPCFRLTPNYEFESFKYDPLFSEEFKQINCGTHLYENPPYSTSLLYEAAV
jgi:hypothetical protein